MIDSFEHVENPENYFRYLYLGLKKNNRYTLQTLMPWFRFF